MKEQCEIIGTWLFFIVYGSVALVGIYFLSLECIEKIKRKMKIIADNKNKKYLPELPDGKEFDRYFVSVMCNKGSKLIKISGNFENKIKLDRMIWEEKRREEFEYINSIDYSKKY